MKPTIGRIVRYRLDRHDVDCIEQRRACGTAPYTGGNPVSKGQIYPAMIVRCGVEAATDPAARVNLQVFLDGCDTHWATSKTCCVDGPEGTEPSEGCWAWPPRDGK